MTLSGIVAVGVIVIACLVLIPLLVDDPLWVAQGCPIKELDTES